MKLIMDELLRQLDTPDCSCRSVVRAKFWVSVDTVVPYNIPQTSY